MAIKFPRVLAAVQKRERSQWEIGDALIAECGPAAKDGVHDGSYAKIVACSEELLRGGHDYSVTTLAQYREIACKFPKSCRQEGVSFSAHKSAGSPEILKTIINCATKGVPISPDYVLAMRKAERAADRPRKNPLKSPREDTRLISDLSDVSRGLHQAQQRIVIHDLPPAHINSAIEALLKIADSARTFVDLLRKHQRKMVAPAFHVAAE